jgi:hypothetical protein
VRYLLARKERTAVTPDAEGEGFRTLVFRQVPLEPSAPPVSTAPSRLTEEAVGPKRKREHSKKYERSIENGKLDESQHAKIGRR